MKFNGNTMAAILTSFDATDEQAAYNEGRQEAFAELAAVSKVKGVWIFNESISLQTAGAALAAGLHVSFMSAGVNFNVMAADTSGLYYDGEETITAYSVNNWSDETYRTVDFGATEQDVPVDFFVWLLANATESVGGNYDEGYAAGQTAERAAFWASYQNNGGDYTGAFGGKGWNDTTYNPAADIIATAGSAEAMFQYAQMTDTKVNIEVRVEDADQMFRHCSKLKNIPYLAFYDVTSTSNFFTGCTNLESVNFGGVIQKGLTFANSSKLTNESVQSIIDHLADLTGQTSQKLTLHATVGAKVTAEQKAAITAKNWTLTY